MRIVLSRFCHAGPLSLLAPSLLAPSLLAPSLLAPSLLALLALSLASCGPGRNEFPPACPVPEVVRPLAELARFRGPSQDIRDLIIRARIVDVTGKCKPGDKGTLEVTAQAVMDIARGPAMQGTTYDLPLFIAVTDAGAIRDKTLIGLRVAFERNQDTARVASQVMEMTLPVTTEKSGAAYGIVAGFQLTPEEVAAARQNRPR